MAAPPPDNALAQLLRAIANAPTSGQGAPRPTPPATRAATSSAAGPMVLPSGSSRPARPLDLLRSTVARDGAMSGAKRSDTEKEARPLTSDVIFEARAARLRDLAKDPQSAVGVLVRRLKSEQAELEQRLINERTLLMREHKKVFEEMETMGEKVAKVRAEKAKRKSELDDMHARMFAALADLLDRQIKDLADAKVPGFSSRMARESALKLADKAWGNLDK